MPPTTLTVTGTFEAQNGATATGTVTFKGNTPRRNVNGGVIVPQEPLIVTLVAGALPAGFKLIRDPAGYTVIEQMAGAVPYTYQLPDQAGPVDLSAFH